MIPETNCPKCGNKFATKIGEQNVCPKCLFEFVMGKTNTGGNPTKLNYNYLLC